MLSITYAASNDDIVECYALNISEFCGHDEKVDGVLSGDAHNHGAVHMHVLCEPPTVAQFLRASQEFPNHRPCPSVLP